MLVYSYQRLWKMLSNLHISLNELIHQLNISSSTIAKMRRNEKVSDNVLNKIAQYLGVEKDDLYELKSDIQVWMEDISPKICGLDYTIRLNGWPIFRFKLTMNQIKLYKKLMNTGELDNIIANIERIINMQNPINAGIVGSSKFTLENDILTLEGSYGVIKNFIKIVFLN